MPKRAVSYSELKSRRRCPYKSHLEYDRRLAPKITSTGLREGTVGDEGMNALYLHHRETGVYNIHVMISAMFDAFSREERRMEESGLEVDWDTVTASWEMQKQLAANYVEYAKTHDRFDRIIEMQFAGRTPVIAPSGRPSTLYDYLFKCDGLVVVNGKLWLLENKWFKNIDRNTITSLQIDEQCSMYLWGLNQLIDRGTAPQSVMDAVAEYGRPMGVYYNIVRKKLPAIPELNANGKTSVRANIDTTHEVYLNTLLERGQDPADYADILAALEAKGNTFFIRHAVYRNARELEEIGQRIYDMTRYVAEGYTFKSPTRDCIWECSFWSLCLEWSDLVVEHNFRVKESVHEQYEDTDQKEVAA
jgi:hypothetical protein